MANRIHVRAVCIAWIGASCVVGGSAGEASAGDLSWDDAKALGAVSVRDRSREAWTPDGMKLGNFLLFPEVGLGTTWTGAGTGAARYSDFRHQVFTGLELRSLLPRHFLGIKAEGRAIRYQDNDELSYIDGGVGSQWRLDITHGTSLIGGMSVALGHSENVDAERPEGAKDPPELLKSSAEIGIKHTAGRIDAAVGARYARFDFQDAIANDGSRIDIDWQDYEIVSPFAHLGWRISPGYRVFADVTGRLQENRGNETVDRDARGAEVTAGVEFEITPLVRASLAAGWMQQDYRQAGLVDISEPIWEGRLEWLVTPLVTLTLSTRRQVQATTFGAASGQLVSTHALKADYEMWRNLIITAQGSLKQASFIGETREDTIWSGGINAVYMHTKNWLLSVSYEHQELVSSDKRYDRSLDRVGVSVKYRF